MCSGARIGLSRRRRLPPLGQEQQKELWGAADSGNRWPRGTMLIGFRLGLSACHEPRKEGFFGEPEWVGWKWAQLEHCAPCRQGCCYRCRMQTKFNPLMPNLIRGVAPWSSSLRRSDRLHLSGNGGPRGSRCSSGPGWSSSCRGGGEEDYQRAEKSTVHQWIKSTP